MNILHIVLLSSIILISLVNLIAWINCCGIKGISYFIYNSIAEVFIIPFVTFFVQLLINLYCLLLINGYNFDGNSRMIMYYPGTVLLATGVFISFLFLVSRLSYNEDNED